MMRWLIALLLLALAPSAQAQRNSDRIGHVTWAAYAEHKLWFIAGDGGLFSFDPEVGDEVAVAFEHGVMRAAYVEGALWAVQDRPPENGDAGGVTVWRLRRGAAAAFARLDNPGAVLAFTIVSGAPVIRTQAALWRYDLAARTWRRSEPPTAPRDGRVSMTSSRKGDLYTALDAGEWGGALMRLARGNRGFGGDLCEARAACGGPVRKLVADALTDDCVIAAISLQHQLLSTGRVLRVCGDQTNVAFERALPERRQPGDQIGSEAVLDVAASTRGIWVETTRGLHRVARNGFVTEEAAPRLRQVAGVWIGRLPGLYVIASGHDDPDVTADPPYLLAPTD